MGLTRGDIIEEINKKPVQNMKQVEDAFAQPKALLRVVREGRTFFYVIEK